MNQHGPHFQEAIQSIDQMNAEDPNLASWEGKDFPKELLYSMRMSDCLESYAPDASEALTLAARSHHICRWKTPRSQFPEGRSGYLKWRNTLKDMHAKLTSEILEEVGYEKALIAKVADLILKKGLKKDLETQVLEDVICLVFLEHYIDAFATKTEDDKLIEIIRKTWRKMSEKGQERAMNLKYSAALETLVSEAIKPGPAS